MRVDVLTFATLLLHTQWVAGNPQEVKPKNVGSIGSNIYEDSNANNGNSWETDMRYASASPYMSVEGDNSMSAPYGIVTVYPTGEANKETSSPGIYDQSDSIDDSEINGEHTKTIYITVGDDNDTLKTIPDGPETVTLSDDSDKPDVITPVIQVNMQVINGETVPVTSTISTNEPDEPTDNSPQVITVTADPTEKDANPTGPSTVTVYGSPSPTDSAIVKNDGQDTVTVTQTNLHTDYVTVTDGVASNNNSQGNGGDTNIVVVGGQNGNGAVVDGANGVVSLAPNNSQQQQPLVPSKTTYLKTIQTASMDIVRVIGPTYTSTIAINGNYVGNQPTSAPQMLNPYYQNGAAGAPPMNNAYFGQNNGVGNNGGYPGQNGGGNSYPYYGQNNGGLGNGIGNGFFPGQNSGGGSNFPGQSTNMNSLGQQNTLSQAGSSNGAINTNVPVIQ
ncbi:hypothetical protein COEREDRAFT_11327 [Coemansia reversa NRRL 1564]|uniref:Uncharacterized protein n=1 Tax=Coemansia reversa (strain ATCC 12441 / NRRL 1564) TaxID=763665 RepID=A0A2G5B3G1_COERN|nr:hypothetical protein COEREDRAFT_11327 [Coemansia reversa NRRL 1564]|eukprot:PIA13560.1 hypothetical protein COEREDRAFT_11327 [Coemansia reversa NRRL 1564]